MGFLAVITFIFVIIALIAYAVAVGADSKNNKNCNSNNGLVIKSEEWVREQRNKMNRKYKNGLTLREYILSRDNYTCKKCGLSRYKEPHLLLEVDHIVPVSKGGSSIEGNLQTLCWQCNRSKSNH